MSDNQMLIANMDQANNLLLSAVVVIAIVILGVRMWKALKSIRAIKNDIDELKLTVKDISNEAKIRF